MTRETDHVEGGQGELGRATGMRSSEVVMPAGWRILVEGEEPVVALLRDEGDPDFGTEGQMLTVTYRDGVYRVESGSEDEFWAVAGRPDDEGNEL